LAYSLYYEFLTGQIDKERAVFEYISLFRFFRHHILNKWFDDTKEEASCLKEEFNNILANALKNKTFAT